MGFTVWRLTFSTFHKHSPSVWILWNPTLHTRNHWKSIENEYCVKGWILFSGNKNRIYARAKRAFDWGRRWSSCSRPYIYAREKSIFKTDCGFFSPINPLRLPRRTLREVLFISRRLVRTTPWLGKTSPGLVRTTLRLVEKAFHNNIPYFPILFTSETAINKIITPTNHTPQDKKLIVYTNTEHFIIRSIPHHTNRGSEHYETISTLSRTPWNRPRTARNGPKTHIFSVFL